MPTIVITKNHYAIAVPNTTPAKQIAEIKNMTLLESPQFYNHPNLKIDRVSRQYNKALFVELGEKRINISGTKDFFNQSHTNNDLISKELFDQEKEKIHTQAQRQNMTPFFLDYVIDESDIPPHLRHLNIDIKRVIETTPLHYNEKTQRLEHSLNHTRGEHSDGEIRIYDKVLFLPPDVLSAYNKYRQIYQAYSTDTERKAHLTTKEYECGRTISYIAQIHMNKDQKLYSLIHELKHEQNKEDLKKRQAKLHYAELAPEEIYLYKIDDEISACMQETYAAVARYLKSCDKQPGGDLTLFPQKCSWLKDSLKSLTPEERIKKCQNDRFICEKAHQHWYETRSEQYLEKDGQIETHVSKHLLNSTLLDTAFSAQEYLNRRHEMYTFPIYNPTTKQYQKKDVSSLVPFNQIPDHGIDFLNRCETKYQEKLEALIQLGLTPSVIQQVRNRLSSFQDPEIAQKQHLFKNPFTFSHTFGHFVNQAKITIKQLDSKTPHILQLRGVEEAFIPKNKPPRATKAPLEESCLFNMTYNTQSGEYTCYFPQKESSFSNIPARNKAPLPFSWLRLMKTFLYEGIEKKESLNQQALTLGSLHGRGSGR